MECTAQVSFEYLLLASFVIILATSAALLIDSIRGLALASQSDILNYRNKTIGSLLS
ncbi:MAG TPA: hypothetical protein VI977_04315 [archaeon]|nr:hypothetical protein [archaeon]